MCALFALCRVCILCVCGVTAGTRQKPARRNAWGNQSYADLITMAIECSTDKRLTLSQIYDWMVQNVPYFRDKGDMNSSAGWKVLFALPRSSLLTYIHFIFLVSFVPSAFSQTLNQGVGLDSFGQVSRG